MKRSSLFNFRSQDQAALREGPKPMTTRSARMVLIVSGLAGIGLAFGQPHDWLWFLCGVLMPFVSFTLAAGFPFFTRHAARLKRLMNLPSLVRR